MRPFAGSRGSLVAALAFVFAAAIAPSAQGAYIRAGNFGTQGSGSGQFGNEPGRAAVEQSTGNLFVVDPANDRVEIFKPGPFAFATPTFVTEFGAGTLDDPLGIAITEAAGETSVYVTDGGNDRIVKFASDEEAVPSFSIDAGFTSPALGTEADQIGSFHSAVAAAPNGDIWVADSGTNLVKRFDPTGAHVAGSDFDGAGSGTAFVGLLDVAVNSTGDLYVIDANGAIGDSEGSSRALRFGSDGTYKAQLVPIEHDKPAVVGVSRYDDSVVVSGAEDAVYTDRHPTLHRFDSANASLGQLTVESQYSIVTGIAFDDDPGRLYSVFGSGTWPKGGGFWGSPNVGFYPNVAKLTVETPGVGLGDVDANSGAIVNCANGGACSDFYFNGTYTLTATEVPHSFFVEWEGCDSVSPGGDECTVEIDGGDDRVVRAFFERYKQPVSVEFGGSGEGRVNGKPGPISQCGLPGGICEGQYNEASAVTLTAFAAENSVFTGWEGGCAGGVNPCVVEANSPTAVTAVFVRKREVDVQQTGTGTGVISSDPEGVECVGKACEGFYAEGQLVSLEATPAENSTFVGWSGGGCSGTGDCEVTVAPTPTLVTAEFALKRAVVTTSAGAANVGQRTGTVLGTVNPGGTDVSDCHIRFGPTPTMASQIPCSPTGVRGRSPVGVGATLRGLTPSTAYYFQVVATNPGGTSVGTMETFTTLADTCDSNELLCPPMRAQATPTPRKKLRCGKRRVKRKGRCVKKRASHHRRRAASRRRGRNDA
jgi:hypothetical protein